MGSEQAGWTDGWNGPPAAWLYCGLDLRGFILHKCSSSAALSRDGPTSACRALSRDGPTVSLREEAYCLPSTAVCSQLVFALN